MEALPQISPATVRTAIAASLVCFLAMLPSKRWKEKENKKEKEGERKRGEKREKKEIDQ